MKRLYLILIALILLTGCTKNTPETTLPETTAAPTEPPIPWIQELGRPWDEKGALVELPLTIPDGLHYDSAVAFDGDLLLWSIDNHRENIRTTELCLVDLDTGKVAAQAELDFGEFVSPQVLGNSIFLCDSQSGKVLELNHGLETVNNWNLDPMEANFHMGADEKLYIYEWGGKLSVLDLKTGEKKSVMGDDVFIDYFSPAGSIAGFTYYHPDTGEARNALVDLNTGAVMEPSLQKEFSYVDWKQGTWLCELYRDGSVTYVTDESGTVYRADMGYDSLRLIDGNTLIRTWEDGCNISLHDLSGKTLATAKITASPYSFTSSLIIPSETYGGYFLLLSDYGSSQRLLYWDTSVELPGEDVAFEPVPEPDEAEARIRERVDQIEQTYGVNIRIGDDCERSFYDFSAEIVADWYSVEDALYVLEEALAAYPPNFFPQLCYDDVRSVDIYLVGTLTATNPEYVETYEAFVQEEYDCHVMVVDIFLSDVDTYFHEFSHIIDSFLEWDSWNREDAIFSDETWSSLNPDWFPGYTYDYSWQQYVEDYSAFVDSYSTINPTEDRARVLEYAMSEYGYWTFEDADILISKLEYYCRCIRDAFDTTGWPSELIWEQYLP